jgi:hypothetical protein
MPSEILLRRIKRGITCEILHMAEAPPGGGFGFWTKIETLVFTSCEPTKKIPD